MAAQVALGAALGAAAATACATMRPDSCTDAARAGPEPPPPRVPRFEAPYTAVIFSSLRRGSSSSADDGYGEMGAEMAAMAAVQPGYLGVESSRDSNGFGLTVSYWRTAADALAAARQEDQQAAVAMAAAVSAHHIDELAALRRQFEQVAA